MSLRCGKRCRHAARVDAGVEQRFIGIDIADTGDEALIQQRLFDLTRPAVAEFNKLCGGNFQRFRAEVRQAFCSHSSWFPKRRSLPKRR